MPSNRPFSDRLPGAFRRFLRPASPRGRALALAGTLGLTMGVQVGCSSHATSSAPLSVTAAPAGLAYDTATATYTLGTAVTANAPHSSGGAVTSYGISPALPAGLALDATTGILSGTPTAASPAASYTVTASNAGGQTTCTLRIAVAQPAPAGLSYAQAHLTAVKGTAMSALSPSVSGGPVATYTVAPALPDGLVLDPATGVISGTPTALRAAATYTVSAANDGGLVTFALSLAVVDLAPANLAYSTPATTYKVGLAIAPNLPSSSGGAVVLYTVSPALPAGLILDSATGIIAGTPAALAANATYTLTAVNSGGSTTGTIQFNVIAQAPTALAYADPSPTYTKGLAITPNQPGNAGGLIAAYTVSPALPAGLSLDPATGVISGTPRDMSPAATYTVTGTNSGGTTSCSLTLKVQDMAPANLTYRPNPAIYGINVAIIPNAPASRGGAITSYSVAPALPAGLALDPTTGILSGTPMALTSTAIYTVTGTNATGSTTCALTLSVLLSAPAGPTTPDITSVTYASAGKAGYLASTPDQGAGMTYAWTATNATITAGQGTPQISYTAGAAGPLTLQVEVTNTSGAKSSSATATVVPWPSASLFARDRVHTGTTGVQASVPPQAGVTYLWSVTGGAASLTSGTGSVASYDLGAATGSYQVSVTAQNQAGDTASATRTLQAVSNTFLHDPWSLRQREYHAAALLPDGRLLVTGGDSTLAVWLASTQIYDPYTRAWGNGAPLSQQRDRAACLTLADGRILVAGGFIDINFSVTGSTEIYDPATGTWTSAGNLKVPRVQGTATLLSDGRVLLAGGKDQAATFLDSAEIFDPATRAWSLVPGAMTTPRSQHTATLLLDGTVLLAGGQKTSGSVGWLRSAELFDPAALTFTVTGTMATSRNLHSATRLADGRVLVVGGFAISNADIYDPATGKWTAAASLAGPRGLHTANLLTDGTVLVAGGEDDQNKIIGTSERFDPIAGTWSAPVAMKAAHMNHSATLMRDGTVLAVGGQGGASTTGIQANPEFYDPALDQWSNAGGMTNLRKLHTSARLADGSILAVGGNALVGGYLATTELWSPATGRWTPAASLANARQNHTMTALPDGRLVVIGGENTAMVGPAEVFDPATALWTLCGSAATPTMATPRALHTTTRLLDGRLLVVGGRNANSTATSAVIASAELFDPVTGTWSPAGSLSQARANHMAALLPDGKVLVAGGSYGNNTLLKSAELYDPATNSWTTIGSMFSERSLGTATVLPNGKVLFLGGQQTYAVNTDSGEIYDPATGTWTLIAPMTQSRRAHTATLLPNGKVLVAGGSDGTSTGSPSLASVECYDPATNTWSAVGSLEGQHGFHTAELATDGRVVLIGGSPAATVEYWKP